MKTFDRFIADYNGKYVDFPGGSYAQCVDLVLMYNKECVGAPVIGGNAKDLFYNADLKFYTPIKNTPTAVPQKGDIMCWGPSVGGGFGHTAIVTEANVLTFKSFDQNWPMNTPAHIQAHNDLYKGVIGWLRPKVTVQPVTDSDRVQEIKKQVNSSKTDTEFRMWVRQYLNV